MSEQSRRKVSPNNLERARAIQQLGEPLTTLSEQVLPLVQRILPFPRPITITISDNGGPSGDYENEILNALYISNVSEQFANTLIQVYGDFAAPDSVRSAIPKHLLAIHGAKRQCVESLELIQESSQRFLSQMNSDENLLHLDSVDEDEPSIMRPLIDSMPTCVDILTTLCGHLPQHEFEEVMRRLSREKPVLDSTELPLGIKNFGRFNSYLSAMSDTSLNVWATLKDCGLFLDVLNRDDNGELTKEQGKLIKDEFYVFLYNVLWRKYHGGCPVNRHQMSNGKTPIESLMQTVERIYYEELNDPSVPFVVEHK